MTKNFETKEKFLNKIIKYAKEINVPQEAINEFENIYNRVEKTKYEIFVSNSKKRISKYKR